MVKFPHRSSWTMFDCWNMKGSFHRPCSWQKPGVSGTLILCLHLLSSASSLCSLRCFCSPSVDPFYRLTMVALMLDASRTQEADVRLFQLPLELVQFRCKIDVCRILYDLVHKIREIKMIIREIHFPYLAQNRWFTGNLFELISSKCTHNPNLREILTEISFQELSSIIVANSASHVWERRNWSNDRGGSGKHLYSGTETL